MKFAKKKYNYLQEFHSKISLKNFEVKNYRKFLGKAEFLSIFVKLQ